MVRRRYQRNAAEQQEFMDPDWQDYRQSSPASTTSFYKDSWRQRQASSERDVSQDETWVLWCDERRVLRSMIKLGASDPRTGETWIRRPHWSREEAFSVNVCLLLPFDWDMVDSPAPMNFNHTPSNSDVDSLSQRSTSSLSDASQFERGSYETSVCRSRLT